MSTPAPSVDALQSAAPSDADAPDRVAEAGGLPDGSGPTHATSTRPPSRRVYSLDALRGLAIALMIFVNWQGNEAMTDQLEHVEWDGLRIADLAYPTFMVAIGVSMPFATRTGWRHAWGRAIMLYLIGSALVSFKFGTPFALTPGVLQMAGMAYLIAWYVLLLPRKAQAPVMAGLLALTGAAYLWLERPGVVPGSFEPGTTIGEWFDTWLGMWPHNENPHAWIPAAASVFVGVLAGRICQERTGWARRGRLAALGAGLLAAGALVSLVIPVIKVLWTPSFVLVTGGIAILVLVVLDMLIPPRSKGGLLRPLVLVGGHPLVVYAFTETLVGWLLSIWYWPSVEPGLVEEHGALFAAVAFPLGAFAAGVVLAWVMERANIHIRV